MTHDELLDKVKNRSELEDCWMALQKVVELHRRVEKIWRGEVVDTYCSECQGLLASYPCPTIQAIEKELR